MKLQKPVTTVIKHSHEGNKTLVNMPLHPDEY